MASTTHLARFDVVSFFTPHTQPHVQAYLLKYNTAFAEVGKNTLWLRSPLCTDNICEVRI